MHWDLRSKKGIPSLFCSPLYLKTCLLNVCVFLSIHNSTKKDGLVTLLLYDTWVGCSVLCDCRSYMDSLLLFGLFVWVAGCSYRRRHILSGIDLNQAILYVADVASQHFMEVWYYWSWVLICHYTVSFLWPCLYSICHTAAIHSLCLSRWVELCCSRNYFHAGRLSRTSLLMILSCLATWCLGQSKLAF